ncbi:MAG: putative pre6S rRNA nuclease [Actinomycetota bacterium]|nr:putative pre6S rRNA nuclease [Actinomycetota bacterium]
MTPARVVGDPGAILGLDHGARRIGVAIAAAGTTLAVPLEVIDAEATDAVARLVDLIRGRGVSMVVIGRPTMLSGAEGSGVDDARAFATALTAATGIEVVEHDERMTTVMAERNLRDAGVTQSRRKELKDAVAAQVILQSYLDVDRDRP